MADREVDEERLYCHGCSNEWVKDKRELECPNCHSCAVEVIDHNDDPRDNHIDVAHDSENGVVDPVRNADALPHHPLSHHHPWLNDVSDPDEGDIEHVAYNPAPGIHIQRTTFRSTPPHGHIPQDAFTPLFSPFAGIFNNGHATPPDFADPRGPFPLPGQQPFPTNQHPPSFPLNPMQPRVRTNLRVFGTGDQSANSIHAIMRTMLATMQENGAQPNMHPHAQPRGQLQGNPLDFLMHTLFQFRDPASASHGDAVFTDEAMDRIISQMMEQQGGTGSAPGPATAAAIAALPKRQADKDMVGTDGKAECSVCMDAVLLGDEVMVLPCKHWFHGDCVGAWLKEHDTCPHCRQGIMPKDGPADARSPRSPGQSPRHIQNPWGYGSRPGQTPPGAAMPSPDMILDAAQRMARAPPQSRQGRMVPPSPPMMHMQTMPGAWTQPGLHHTHMPGGYPGYPEPRDFVQLPPLSTPPLSHPPNPPSSTTETRTTTPVEPRRRQSSSTGGSVNGEGSSGSSTGSRIGGWLRNLRGGGSSSTEQR